MVGAAVVGGALVGAGASVYGANKSSSAAGKAAQQQVAASNKAINSQEKMYAQQREDTKAQDAANRALAAEQEARNRAAIAEQQAINNGYFTPYIQTGQQANSQLAYLMGLGGNPNGVNQDGMTADGKYNFLMGENRTGAPYSGSGQAYDYANGMLGEAGSLGRNFTMADFQQDPGYELRLKQGQDALARAQASKGKYFSGGAIKALTDYNQESAGQGYNDAYNRYVQNQTNLYNKLAGITGTGLNATGTLGTLNSNLTSSGVSGGNQLTSNTIGASTNLQNQLANNGANYSNSLTNTLTGIGNSQAAGTIAGGNAAQQGAQGISNNLMGGAMMYGMMGGFNPSSTGYNTGLGSGWNSPGGGLF